MDVNGKKTNKYNNDEIDERRTREEENDILELLNAINGETNDDASFMVNESIQSDINSYLPNDDVFAIDDSIDFENEVGQDNLDFKTLDINDFKLEDSFDESGNYKEDVPVEVGKYLDEANPSQAEKTSKDVGDVFSDALSSVSYLDDSAYEAELLKLIPDIEEESQKEATESQQSTELQKKEKRQLKNLTTEPISKNVNLGKRLFGNVRQERSQDEIYELKQQAIENVAIKEKQEKEKKEKKLLAKKEKEKKAQEQAANKKAVKIAAANKRAENAKVKKEIKTKKQLELQSILDEIDENEGRVNRIGASIVLTLFAICAVVIIIGTNMYTYSISIQEATKYFETRKYNEAYNNVYGMDIKDEDIELYDKIMTVMYVNKQLNSYNNYYTLENYPEALNSLLKGLQRYDKYIELATSLGIENDLNFVREKILFELDNVFKLSEKKAIALTKIEDQTDYSLKVYDVAVKNMSASVSKE